MSIEIFGLLVIALGLVSLWLPPTFSVYCLIALTLFGAASAIGLPALGGANITPASLYLVFFVIRFILWRWPNMSRIIVLKRNYTTGWLLSFIGYGLLSAIILGPLFAGTTQVYMSDRLATGASGQVMEPLRFSSGYLTQTVYILAGVAVFIVVQHYRKVPGMLEQLGRAMLVLAALNVTMGIIDLGTQLTGTQKLLEFMRNAEYAQFAGNVEMGNMRRISGSFPEASAFAGFSMPLMAFALIAWMFRFTPWLAGACAVALLGMLAVSTSSTAYVSLAAFLLTMLGIYVFKLYFSGGKTSRPALLLIVFGSLLAIAVGLYVIPGAMDAVNDFLDQTVFNKLESGSGQERMDLNRQAFVNFTDTWLLGVGMGGATASSYPLVLLANVGLPGFVMFVGAVIFALKPTRESAMANPATAAVIYGARAAVFAHLLAATVSARVIDPGLLFFVLLGIASPGPRPPRVRQRPVAAARARLAERAAAAGLPAGAAAAGAGMAALRQAAGLRPPTRFARMQQHRAAPRGPARRNGEQGWPAGQPAGVAPATTPPVAAGGSPAPVLGAQGPRGPLPHEQRRRPRSLAERFAQQRAAALARRSGSSPRGGEPRNALATVPPQPGNAPSAAFEHAQAPRAGAMPGPRGAAGMRQPPRGGLGHPAPGRRRRGL